MTDHRLSYAVSFAERATNMGASALTACKLAADLYHVDPDAVLTEWTARLMAKAVAEEAITRARG